MKQIAIFDVCDTLYNVNTTYQFLDQFLINNKKYFFFRKISKLFPVKVLNYFFYKLLNVDFLRNLGTLFLKGKKVEEIKKFTYLFVQNNLALETKKIIATKINEYKENI